VVQIIPNLLLVKMRGDWNNPPENQRLNSGNQPLENNHNIRWNHERRDWHCVRQVQFEKVTIT